MTQRTRATLASVLIAMAAVVLGLVTWHERGTSVTPPTTSSTALLNLASSTSTVASSSPGYTITPVQQSRAPAAPNHATPLSFPSSFTTDERTSYESQFGTVQKMLSQNPTQWSAWVQLGILRKDTGDYVGAVTDWKYVTKIYPHDATAFGDLADLYANYLHEYALAESNWLQAIKVSPANPLPYQNLFTLYTTTPYTGGSNAAASILKQGIVANPGSFYLEVLLARYYKAQGDIPDAKARYSAAVTNAQALGQNSVAAQIQVEANSI